MGVCSYCLTYRSWDWGSECFSWDEARGCSGITGPDDPKYIALKRAYEQAKAHDTLREARALRKQARDTLAKARTMESRAKKVLSP